MAENAFLWSTTASSNDTADPAVPWAENMLPGQVNNSARSTMAGIARLLQDLNGSIATTGSANAYLATSNSGHTTYTDAILITLKANFTNTAAATINLNSFGAKAIRVYGSAGETDVSANQIISGGTYQFRYNTAANSAAGAFILLNPNVDATALLPIGGLMIWTTNTAPAGTVFSNAQALSRTTYANLFAVIGTTYGAGDGSTTFNVPDLCGRVPVGKDDMGGISAKGRITNAETGLTPTTLGNAGGVQSTALSTAQLPSHTHTGATDSGGAHTHTGTADAGGSHTHIGTTDSAGLHTHTVGLFTNAATAAGGFAPYATTGSAASPSTSNDGAHTHTFTTASGGSHTHTFTTDSAGTHAHSFTTAATGSGSTHTNLQPSIILNYVIKY